MHDPLGIDVNNRTKRQISIPYKHEKNEVEEVLNNL
jgi:hypothetical protein